MRAVVHLELVERTAAALDLRIWHENPNEVCTRTLRLAEVEDLVRGAERDYYSPLPKKLEEVGRRLFRWLDGDGGTISAEIAAAQNRAAVLVLAIATPHRLGHLPWEVLHDGTSFLAHGLNPAVLPVRWRSAGGAGTAPRNRPLQLLFMASSPEGGGPALDYEGEESAILEATRRAPLELTVEESGSLEELGALVRDYGDGFFDVLHLTGHAGHGEDGTPVFLLEDGEGCQADATPLDLARALPSRPPLVFVSGCRTGQDAGHGEVRSFAEQLIGSGFRTVLGWGRPVRDSEATAAAEQVYAQLAAGASLPQAVSGAHAELFRAEARDWHLLRLFCAGDPPGALVTPLRTSGRIQVAPRPAETEFLDLLTREVKVATRAAFVGRRRLLQCAIRHLRAPAHGRVGVLLHGQGGRGKSSVAARLCDRLRELQRMVVVGRFDEPSLVRVWEPRLPDEAARQALRDPSVPLRYRIEERLRALAGAGRPAPLFVLDDFEQNQPEKAAGDLTLARHAADALRSLCEALESTGFGRLLVTCRYTLPQPFAAWLHAENVVPLDVAEQRKQALRLDRQSGVAVDPELRTRAFVAADGNPRLFEWLHAVLRKPGLDHAAILAGMEAAEERFREDILARYLVASLPPHDRSLLARMLLVDVPIPLAAVRALDHERDGADLLRSLRHAVDLGLVDVTMEDGEEHFRVARQLAGGNPPVLERLDDGERAAFSGALFDVLRRAWWTEAENAPEPRILARIALAAGAGRKDELADLSRMVTSRWLQQDRYRDVRLLLESVIDAAGRHHFLLLNLARAIGPLGDTEPAGALLREAMSICPPTAGRERCDILFHLAGWLQDRGELEQAVDFYQTDLLPVLERLGDVRSRAVTQGKIADVLMARGELDEALRIRREEELPVYERLGDVRSRAVTLGKIADVLMARGELDEALRIRREEQLPVYERLGDVRELLVGRVKLAQCLVKRGREEDRSEVVENLAWSYRAAVAREYAEAGQIAAIFDKLGLELPPTG